MALIKCTECNKKFSEYANACPNCACPIEIVNENILIKKEEQYNKAINIIATYKTKKELYLAKQILTSLDNYKESSDKRKDIDNLLNYEHECQIIKIKRFFNKKRIITILAFIIIVLCINKLMEKKSAIEMAIEEFDKLQNTLIMNGYIKDSKYSDSIDETQILIKKIENETYSFAYNIDTMSAFFQYRSSSLDNNIEIFDLDKNYLKNNYKCEDVFIQYDIIEEVGTLSCTVKSYDNLVSFDVHDVHINYNEKSPAYYIDTIATVNNRYAFYYSTFRDGFQEIINEFNNYIKESNVNIDIIKEYKNIN